MNRIIKYVVVTTAIVAIMAAAFVGGIIFDRSFWGWPEIIGLSPAPSDLGDKVDQVRRMLDAGALEPSDEESMTAGAINGLLESLGDPYAAYFNEEHYAYFNEQNNGEFFGIGVTISQLDDQVVIVSPIDGTPAFEAGLEAGDVIRAIDGEVQDTWDIDVVVSRVRGPEGTRVALDIEREDIEGTLNFEIVRGRITVPNLMTELIGDDVGYMRLGSFNDKAAGEIATALVDLADQGAKGYILDLRDNPGGLLTSSVDVSSLFIEDGIIVRVNERDRPQIEHRARGRAKTDAPLVVLINEYSASASEIVAGALQDYARADLVGTLSFGKGSVQTVEDLSFGGGVKFTIAHYLTPKSREINGVGLTPDYVVDMDPMLQADREDDIQLDKAVEVLREQF